MWKIASPSEGDKGSKNAIALTLFGAFAIAVTVVLAFIAIAYQSNDIPISAKLWQMGGVVLAIALASLSYLPVFKAADPNSKSAFGIVPSVIVFDTVCFVVGGLVIVSFPSGADARFWGGAAIWGLACLAIGGIGGFLFGIPRSRREGRPLQTNGPQQPPTGSPPVGSPPGQQNANGTVQSAAGDPSPIEQIADWLTKIIVGLGLVNLKQVPTWLDRWASYAASSIGATFDANHVPDDFHRTFALGLIIYFTILGFMSTYILTQVFLLRLVNQNTSDNS